MGAAIEATDDDQKVENERSNNVVVVVVYVIHLSLSLSVCVCLCVSLSVLMSASMLLTTILPTFYNHISVSLKSNHTHLPPFALLKNLIKYISFSDIYFCTSLISLISLYLPCPTTYLPAFVSFCLSRSLAEGALPHLSPSISFLLLMLMMMLMLRLQAMTIDCLGLALSKSYNLTDDERLN